MTATKTRTNIYLSNWILKRFREDDFFKRRLSKIVDELLTNFLHGDDMESLKREMENYDKQLHEIKIKRIGTKFKIKDIQMSERKKELEIKEKDNFINEIAQRFKKAKRNKISKEKNKEWLEYDIKNSPKKYLNININKLIDYLYNYCDNQSIVYSNWS